MNESVGDNERLHDDRRNEQRGSERSGGDADVDRALVDGAKEVRRTQSVGQPDHSASISSAGWPGYASRERPSRTDRQHGRKQVAVRRRNREGRREHAGRDPDGQKAAYPDVATP